MSKALPTLVGPALAGIEDAELIKKTLTHLDAKAPEPEGPRRPPRAATVVAVNAAAGARAKSVLAKLTPG